MKNKILLFLFKILATVTVLFTIFLLINKNREKEKMKASTLFKIIIFFLPLIVLIDLNALTYIMELLRQKSDIAVLMGVCIATFILVGHYFIINLFIKHFKNTKK